MRAHRVAASFAVAIALASHATTAHAADVQACLSASESGQRARAAGKLREARGHFLVCANDACPGLVRRDCAQWTTELTASMPSVVFGARDKQGHDLFDVTVAMDGEVLVDKLDGKAVLVDPGPHTFRFETAGAPPVTERVLVKEGEKSRMLSVTFGAPGEGQAAANERAQPGGSATPDARAAGERERGHGALPWIVVGVGGALVVTGVVLLVTTPDRPPNCSAESKVCARRPDQSDADFAADRDTAGQADSQPVIGWAVTGIGAAFVAGGLLWHFFEPTHDAKAARPRVVPWTTGRAGGVTVGGSF